MNVSRVIKLALICIFGVTPFLYNNNFYSVFELPKVLWFIAWVGILLLLFLFLVFKKRVRPEFDFFDLLALLWIIVLWGASLKAGNFAESFWGNSVRHQGIFAQINLVLLFVFVRRVDLVDSRIKLAVYKAILWGGILQTLLLLVQFIELEFLGWEISNYSGRPIGTFGQPNFAAGYLVASFGVSLIDMSKKNKYSTFVSLFIFMGILATRSLGGVLGAAVCGAVYLASTLKEKRKKYFLLAVCALILPAFLYLSFLKESINLNPAGVPRTESRLVIWHESLKLFVNRPLLGYGAENIQLVYPDAFGGVTVDRAHNLFLDILLSGGIFLGAIWLYLVGSALVKAFTNKKLLVESVVFSGLLVREMTNVSSIVNLALFWLLLALILEHNHSMSIASPKE